MALTIETGSVVAGADSYISTTDATSYATARGVTLSASGSGLEVLCRKAYDWLRDERQLWWRGTRQSVSQTGSWPRTGAVQRGGLTVPDNTVPQAVKDAQCQLVLLLDSGEDIAPNFSRGGQVASRSVGPISTSFFQGAPADTLYSTVMGFLWPYLRATPLGLDPLPYDAALAQNVEMFAEGTYDNSTEDTST